MIYVKTYTDYSYIQKKKQADENERKKKKQFFILSYSTGNVNEHAHAHLTFINYNLMQNVVLILLFRNFIFVTHSVYDAGLKCITPLT